MTETEYEKDWQDYCSNSIYNENRMFQKWIFMQLSKLSQNNDAFRTMERSGSFNSPSLPDLKGKDCDNANKMFSYNNDLFCPGICGSIMLGDIEGMMDRLIRCS